MKIKDVLKANICAFGETIFDNFSLEEEKFMESLDFYITDNNYKNRLEDYAYALDYDTEDINNITMQNGNKELDYINIMNCCRQAYIKTITIDKTIDAEAFIDNIINEIKK